MGMFMKEHDVHVSSFQDQLNQRFAPSVKGHPGGLDEMIALQKEFGIFKEGRRFETSLSALNIGASLNGEARRRFHLYLASLRKEKSNVAGKNGDAAVVDAIVRNLAAKKPLPIYFQPHDLTASADSKRVIITDKARPLFYVNQDYLVVSLPVDNKAGTKPAAKAPAKKTKAKKKAG
jgi:mRNA-degrading endonuclease YafQ of YafQ-DinJ toxin-antitoxin module